MCTNRWFATASAFLLAGSFLLHAEISLAAAKIGVAAATKGTVTGNTRSLSSGSEVFTSEVVRTGEASNAQLLFLDETNLSIGPKSVVTLDRFVFDPNRKTGQVILSTGVGAFRFVSGSQQSSNYQIKTPVATIGVRGTIVQWTVIQLPGGGYSATFYVPSGEIVLNFNGKKITLKHGESLIYSSLTGFQGPWKGDIQDLQNTYITDGKNFDATNILNSTGNSPCFGESCGGQGILRKKH